MTHDEQIKAWVEGRSLHSFTEGECVPDFSCCQPDLKVDEATRRRFGQAHEEKDIATLTTMYSVFMEALLTKHCSADGKISIVNLAEEKPSMVS